MPSPFQTADIDAALTLANSLICGSPRSEAAALLEAIGAWLDTEEVATRMDARQNLDADLLFPETEED